MKRVIVLTVMAAALCSFLLAAETVSSPSSISTEPRCATGGFWVMKDGFSAGFGEWSFPLYSQKNGFFIRDGFTVGGFNTLNATRSDSVGGFLAGNRIQIGGSYNCTGIVIRTYGFMGLGMGMFSNETKKLVDAPYVASCIGGGGFEIQYSPYNAFIIEFGGDNTGFFGNNCKNWAHFTTMSPILILGFRSYY